MWEVKKTLLVTGIPLFLKNWILHYKYYSQGSNQYSGVMTNLGKVELPAEMMEKIRLFRFHSPATEQKAKDKLRSYWI